MGWKYVMFKIGMYHVPVLFPDKLVHSDVAEALMPVVQTLSPNGKNKPTVVSAGEANYPNVRSVSGASSTLNKKSRKKDEGIINTYTYTHGIE